MESTTAEDARCDSIFTCSGCDTDGQPYDSNTTMWNTELGSLQCPSRERSFVQDATSGLQNDKATPRDSRQWYGKSSAYWAKQEASVCGMLGGMDDLHDRDIAGSAKFLTFLRREHGLQMGKSATAMDVGAGIGRITKALLLPRFGVVDMLEQNRHYLDKSISYIAAGASPVDSSAMGDGCPGVVDRRMAVGMQNFRSVECKGRYTLIWIQWCVIYLTDNDFVIFMRECFESLLPGGIVCVKDNVTPRGQYGFVHDKADSSVMRSAKYMRALFSKAGAVVLSETTQRDFPRNNFPVMTWALAPPAS